MMMMMAQVADQKGRSHDDDDDDGCLLSSVVGAAAGHGHPTSSYGDVAAAKRLKTRGGGTMSTKEKKDKIGERVAALQQLVSPFGKSDTASVLQEATGYIRFLHEQLQVLSAPYMRTPLIGQAEGAEYYSLRSRGLCLVPVSSTVKFAQSNGADLWAPANSRRCQ